MLKTTQGKRRILRQCVTTWMTGYKEQEIDGFLAQRFEFGDIFGYPRMSCRFLWHVSMKYQLCCRVDTLCSRRSVMTMTVLTFGRDSKSATTFYSPALYSIPKPNWLWRRYCRTLSDDPFLLQLKDSPGISGSCGLINWSLQLKRTTEASYLSGGNQTPATL